MEFRRKENEDLLTYQIRLYENKVAYGLNNYEIGQILNKETEQNLDESAYRKPIQAILKYSNNMRETWYTEGYNSALNKKGYKTIIPNVETFAVREKNIKKREMMVQSEQAEINRYWRLEARTDRLKETILDYVQDVEKIKPIKSISVEDMQRLMSEERNRIAVLTLSDWHYGEEIDNFIAKYNTSIFDSMIEKLVEDTVLYCNLMKIKTLKIVSMGDLMSGMIHLTTRLSNEKNIVEQTMYVAEMLSNMIAEISKHVPNIEFYSTVDNHGRINPNYKEHIEKESFTILLHHIVGIRLRQLPNVKIMENEINGVEEFDIGVMNIYDRQAIFVHGHNDKLNSNKIKDLILFSKIPNPICIFMGHYHKNFEDEIHGIDLIVNPALVPTGEYAKKLRASSLSRQKMTIFDKKENGEVFREATFFITM